MTEEEKLRQIELLLIDIKDAYYGGYRACADESNIASVEWAIDNLKSSNIKISTPVQCERCKAKEATHLLDVHKHSVFIKREELCKDCFEVRIIGGE